MALKSLSFTLLVVNIDSEEYALFADILNEKRMMAPDFFSDAPIVIKVDDNTLNLNFAQLKQIVDEQGFVLLGVTGDLSEAQKVLIKDQKIAILKSAKQAGSREKVEAKSDNQTVVVERRAYVSPQIKTQIHTGRVRSGQQIYAKECDLVINGDVGAGAEVIADGTIHIYGALRGKALAGAMGNKKAAIFCQALNPELVSIAGVYKLSDDLSTNFVGKSCVVSLDDEQIVLDILSRI